MNLVKIWVDDRNGRAPRLAPNLFRAIIDEGHKHGLQVNAHVFYYTDAVDLVNAGVDALVHLVRDKEMDDALVASIVQHNVYVQPNLSPEWNTYTELPHWLKDGDPLMTLLQESTSPPVIARMKTAFGGRDPPQSNGRGRNTRSSSAASRDWPRPTRRSRSAATPASRITCFGMSEQHELESMVKAGMTPMQVIVAATSRPAEYLKLAKMGTLAPGKEADFLVLDANPLDDITNTQRISNDLHEGRRGRPSLPAAVTDQDVHELTSRGVR